MAAILHVYAGGLNFMKYFFLLSFLEKEDGNTFTLLIILIHSEKSSKRAKKHYDPQSAEINLQSPQSDSSPWAVTLMSFSHMSFQIGLISVDLSAFTGEVVYKVH